MDTKDKESPRAISRHGRVRTSVPCTLVSSGGRALSPIPTLLMVRYLVGHAVLVKWRERASSTRLLLLSGLRLLLTVHGHDGRVEKGEIYRRSRRKGRLIRGQ